MEIFGDYVNRDYIFTKIEKRREVIDKGQEDNTSELGADESDVEKLYEIEREYEYDAPKPQDIAGGRRRKFIRPLILKGGAGAKYEKWKLTVSHSREQLTEKLNKWKVLKKMFNDHKKNEPWNGIYEAFRQYYGSHLQKEEEAWKTIVKTIFPIFYNKMTKDLKYHADKAGVDRSGVNPRINPMATYCTKMSDYMNELSSEIDALEAEMDNDEKREIKKQEKSELTDAVDKIVTNQISRLMARKGLEYAKASLTNMKNLPQGSDKDVPVLNKRLIDICLDYIKYILSQDSVTRTAKLTHPSSLPEWNELPGWVVSYQILIHHIYFLGLAYVQHKNCLPDIDAKLINYWRYLSQTNKAQIGSRIMEQPELEGLVATKQRLRVINNGIPSNLKDIFHDYVYCPSSSVCDAMGNFGSCAGNKKTTEFYGMNINIVSKNGDDYYDVYSKIDIRTVEVVTNSFILYFPTGEGDAVESMVIECRLGNINLDEKPDMLSANNVFKVTLQVIEGILKEAQGPMNIEKLWDSLYTSENFKKIITPMCQKATGDINQELNSIVKNGGYYDYPSVGLDSKYTVGLAGDRPSGVRMALLALYADKGQLLANYVVGYGNVSESFLIQSLQPTPAQPVKRKGGGVRKTRLRNPKIMKTRKNKLHHYKMMSKRRKHNNKTKNRK
jgi:hypothetical protein